MTLVTALRTEYTADFARRTAERPDTNRAGVIAREEWYTALATDAARLNIYGFAGYQALVDDLLAGRPLNARNEKRVAIVVREVRDLINLRITKVGLKQDAVKRAALNVAREIAMMDGEYGRPKHGAGTAVHIVSTETTRRAPLHFDDVQAEIAMSAAGGITTHFTSGVIPPLSGETEFFEIGDASHIASLVEYLLALVPALKRADRSEIGLRGEVLHQEAVDALSNARDGRGGTTQEVQRASRRIAAHRSTIAGLEGEELAAEEARFAADVAKRPEAFEAAQDVLEGREVFALDESFDSPVEDEVESVWVAAMPVFEPLGVRDADELQVLINEMLGEQEVSHVAGLKDSRLSPIALRTQKVTEDESAEEAKARKAEAKRLRETVARIRENVATVGPALRELLAA